MAALAKAVQVMLKKLLVELATNPSKTLQKIIKFVLIILMVFTFIFGLPVIIISSLPTLLFQSSDEPSDIQHQLDTIAIYSDAIIGINETNKVWIDSAKEEYSYCDEFIVSYDNSVTWKTLLAIDSVLQEQDFSNVNLETLIEMSKGFFNKSITTEEYIVEEEFEVEEEYEEEEITIDAETGEEIVEIVIKTRVVIEKREVEKIRAYISIDTKSWEEMIVISGIVEEQDKNIATNIYGTLLSVDIEGNLNIYDDINLDDLQEYPEGTANLPYFHQGDKRWGANNYGTSTILSAGCGPTSLAMVVSGLTNQKYTPDVVANWSFLNGHRAEGSGSYWSLMSAGGQYYGLRTETVSRNNPNRIKEALSQGKPIIVSMGRGNFTNGGHFIVLRGITSSGNILVYDPASVNRSNKEWPISIIMNESSKNGGIYGSPFWIFTNN